MREYIIAIDGYSSCGKSTFAKQIAQRLGYIFIDTGAMYRGVTLAAIKSGVISDPQQLSQEMLDAIDIEFRYNPERGASDLYLGGNSVEAAIRTMEVSSQVSKISAISKVRSFLVAKQREMGAKGGVVMDGRDIGTVVFPNADIKIFMATDPAIRAERRYNELVAKGEQVTIEEIIENITSRDRDDEQRAISPLRRAEDAILLDNGAMSIEQQMEWFEQIYNTLRNKEQGEE